jgi:alkylated DNA repair dioxygenase AlkB
MAETGDIAEHVLFGGHTFLTRKLPAVLDSEARARFDDLWALHPEAFHEITQPFTGKTIPLPRWQQAYGHDYRYTGTVNRALAIPSILDPYLAWSCTQFDESLNGLLLNWYDAEQRHHVGAHRDSRVGLVVGSAIVTISLGATRNFRLRPMRGKGFVDFEARHGGVFILPWGTNLNVKHEVPHQATVSGRRISITLRAFTPQR